MRKILALTALLVVLSPAAAQATGNPQPPSNGPERACPCCVDLDQRIDQLELVWNQRISILEQRISVLENRLENAINYLNEVNNRTTTIINRVEALSCQSDRIYEFRVRTSIDGSPVVAIAPRVGNTGGVEVLGQSVTREADGDRGSWRVNDDGRIVVTASYQGLVVPRGQVRTVVVYLETEAGRVWRTVQKLRLCLEDDGNMQDRSTQGRADD